MRISALAKELGIKSAEVISELDKLGIKDKVAASAIDDDTATKVAEKFGKKLPEGLKKSAAKSSAKKTAKKTAAKAAPKSKEAEATPAPQKAPVKATTQAPTEAPKPKTETAPKQQEVKAAPKQESKTHSDLARKRDEEEKRQAAENERKKIKDAKRKVVEDLKARKKESEELRELERLIADEEKQEKEKEARQIVIDEAITVKEFADKLNLSVNDIIKALFLKGTAVTVNQTLGVDLAQDIAKELGYTIKVKTVEEQEFVQKEQANTSHLPIRPPVVTVMGHVDHGKTSLLDTIRKTTVAAGEAGGITQHIGAYSISINGKQITFLDTPGHEAFTALRARGAQVTDMVVLVVAADDGVMPQTIEAINHAKAAGVNIIVAVNKIDKPGAQPEKVKQELTKYGLVPEDWGGTNIFCNVSAKAGTGVDNLLEMILLQAEVLELRAEPEANGHAIVIESKLDKTRGPVHSIIVTSGTMKIGDPFVMGNTHGKIRAMVNDSGIKIFSAGPSTPLELLGANDICDPGELITVVENERRARQIAQTREDALREKRLDKKHVRLENIVEMVSEGETLELKLVVKADTQGSVEGVKELLGKLEFKEVKIHVIHSGVGAVTESDVSLADASDAIIVGFNIRPTEKAKELAEKTGVEIRMYTIIYEITGDVEASVKGMMKPKFVEVSLGKAEVRDVFKASKIGTIAGCMVTAGLMRRNAECRIVRDGTVIHTGTISSLRRFKDDAKEVKNGFECGIGIDKFNDIKVGDEIETFQNEEVAPVL